VKRIRRRCEENTDTEDINAMEASSVQAKQKKKQEDEVNVIDGKKIKCESKKGKK
jgi:hypothetical protein